MIPFINLLNCTPFHSTLSIFFICSTHNACGDITAINTSLLSPGAIYTPSASKYSMEKALAHTPFLDRIQKVNL